MFKRSIFALLPFVLLISLLLLPSSAFAETGSPWWHLSTGARPTYLRAGVGRDEVQGLTVKFPVGEPQGGVFVVSKPASTPEEEIAGGFAELPYNAEASEVQAGLEGIYGAGVQVTGGPVGKPAEVTGSEPYVITFTGALGYKSFPVISTHLSGILGFHGEASVVQSTAGQPDGQIVLIASNLGDADVDGEDSAVSIHDTLPAGLTAVAIEAIAGNKSVSPGAVDCSLESLTCTFKHDLPPYDEIEVLISVSVTGAKSGERNEASVSGGEAREATVSRPITIAGGATKFGIEDYELKAEQEGGAPDAQAGSHPFQLTTTLALNQAINPQNGEPVPAALPKDLNFQWPAGLIGNPTAVSRCTLGQFLHIRRLNTQNECSPRAAVGAAIVTIIEPDGGLGSSPGAYAFTVPVFNLEPNAGEPARFGFLVPGTPVFIDTAVRSGEDYGITVHSTDISQTAAFLRAEVIVWGVPGAAIHDIARGIGCLGDAREEHLPCYPLEESRPPAFLSLPTSCADEPLRSTVDGDSWADPGDFVEPEEQAVLGPLFGCDAVPFEPSIAVKPDGSAASTPTGLTVDVHNPQNGSVSADGLAEGNPRDITVALPEGVAIDPSGANGLQACSEELVGFEGETEFAGAPHTKLLKFKPWLPGSVAAREAIAEGNAPAGEDELQQGIDFCPDAAKVATVKIKTPLLPNPLEGAVYVATQNQNPFGSLIAMYLIAEDPVSGVLVKLAGQVHLNPDGQIVTTFENTPQAPFEDAELHFFGGENAPLTAPADCGTYETKATLTPWSALPGEPPHTATSTFNISSGPGGSACTYPGQALPFNPSLTGGSANVNAGAFTPLTTTIGREDGQQNLSQVKLHFPPGLSGLLSSVKLCPEAQANEGTCGPESQIGETTVSAGVGSDPVTVKGGKVYITEKYNGAPFGLSIVNPVKAGPFDLEHDTSPEDPGYTPACDCIVVRAKIEVDPHTAALTVTTNSESEGYAIPHQIDGVPVQIKKVNVLVNRPGFTFNPTSCNPMKIEGEVTGGEGATKPVSEQFQVTNCKNLNFTPKFTVSTSGKTSKADGASLTTRVEEPAGSLGTQANIARVKVELPKALPSRLTTLQKACTLTQFNTNPAGCPAASDIGHAKVITPLLPVPLEGPAIFVSHGGEAFPTLTMVLQGYGVTIDLVGTTFISKAGVTSTTFKTVPDAPFSTFELTLLEGKYSALAANGSLCTEKLVMPTEFVGQNGALLKQSTLLSVTGCAKAKALTRAQKLARALKACHRDHNKAKRQQCERLARKRFGVVKKKGKK